MYPIIHSARDFVIALQVPIAFFLFPHFNPTIHWTRDFVDLDPTGIRYPYTRQPYTIRPTTTMADRKLKAAFDRMEAPRLRAVLNGICEHFARNKHAGTIYYVDGKIVLTTESGNRVFQDAFAVREQGNDEQNGSQKDGKGKLEKKKDNIGGAEGVHTANSSSNVMKRKREDTPVSHQEPGKASKLVELI